MNKEVDLINGEVSAGDKMAQFDVFMAYAKALGEGQRRQENVSVKDGSKNRGCAGWFVSWLKLGRTTSLSS